MTLWRALIVGAAVLVLAACGTLPEMPVTDNAYQIPSFGR